MSESEPTKTLSTIIIVFISFIIIATVLIPVLVGIVGQDEGYEIRVGQNYSYSPTVNLPDAEFTYSGTAMDFLTVTEDGSTVSGVFEEWGEYTLTVTAHTVNPDQYATQEVVFNVYEGQGDYTKTRPLLYACVTLIMVGVVLFTIRRFMGGDGDGLSVGSSGGLSRDGGFSISGRMGGSGKR